MGADGRELRTQLWAPATDPTVRDLPAVQVLRLVWIQHCSAEPPDAPMRWRVATDLPPAPLLICTPSAVDARFSTKRATCWVGYNVHLTERCDDDRPNLITDVTTTLSTTADNTMPTTIQQQVDARGLAPAEHLVDAGSVCAENLLDSQKADSDLIGPPPPAPGWRATAKEGVAGSCCILDWDAEVATCPQGQTSRSWRAGSDHEGRP